MPSIFLPACLALFADNLGMTRYFRHWSENDISCIENLSLNTSALMQTMGINQNERALMIGINLYSSTP